MDLASISPESGVFDQIFFFLFFFLFRPSDHLHYLVSFVLISRIQACTEFVLCYLLMLDSYF